jgi:hypothetical protein
MKKLSLLLLATFLVACSPEETNQEPKCNCTKIVQTKTLSPNTEWVQVAGAGQETTDITDCKRNGEIVWKSQEVTNRIYRHVLSCK